MLMPVPKAAVWLKRRYFRPSDPPEVSAVLHPSHRTHDHRVGDAVVLFPSEVCPVYGAVTEGHGIMDESYLPYAKIMQVIRASEQHRLRPRGNGSPSPV